MEFKPDPRDEQTAFNSADAFLEKVMKIEYNIEEALSNWKVIQAFNWLESYENELSFCFTEENRKIIKGFKDKIIAMINEYPAMGQKGLDANHTPYMIANEEYGVTRNLVVGLNQYLRQIKFKNGMTMPNKEGGEGW